MTVEGGSEGPSSRAMQVTAIAGGQGVSMIGTSASVSKTPSVQGSDQSGIQSSGEAAGEEGSEVAKPEQEWIVTPPQGIQARLGTPMAREAVPTPALVMAEEARQGAFAVTPSARVPGFVPLR